VVALRSVVYCMNADLPDLSAASGGSNFHGVVLSVTFSSGGVAVTV
jgi:hypothetical protein